jgi:uncharacterized protein YfaQ (DUF2300 family)
VWKLFVYAWLVDTGAREAAYECRGQSKEEVYCCTAGGKIERDQALVKSCGLYFEPARLGISSADWRAYWQTRQAPEWLLSLPSLQPATRVPVAELLRTLALLPAQDQARRVLLDVVLNAADGNVVGELGGRLRVKTWSWLGDRDPASRQGGFAGWTVDGTPIWAGGRGTSQRVLREYGPALATVLPPSGAAESGTRGGRSVLSLSTETRTVGRSRGSVRTFTGRLPRRIRQRQSLISTAMANCFY